MNPILRVEFMAKAGDETYQEESVPLHSVDEFAEFVAPEGGCEAIPNTVAEIKMVFLPEPGNPANPLSETRVTLQAGMVLLTGSLGQITELCNLLVDKARQQKLAPGFLKAIGASPRT